jgi:putative ABC transport system substrate-binding protein
LASRRTLLSFLLGAGVASVAHAAGTAAKKKLLVVDTQTTEPYITITGNMLATLAEHGFVEGRNLEVLHLSIGQHEGAAANIWRYKDGPGFDVVYFAGTLAARAFAPITQVERNSRFVFASVTDPVGIGLVDGFGSAPTRNVTGVSFPVPVKNRLRFVRRLLPRARTIGLIYGDMPQSISYRSWLERLLLEDPEFKDLKILYRSVQFVPGDNGTKRMALLTPPLVQELNPLVDVFLAPNDQMGINPEFAHTVAQHAAKPLVGIIEPDAREGWGAAMTIYPSLPGMGRQAGKMVARLLAGAPVSAVPAETPADVGVAFDWQQVQRFGIAVPADLAAASRAPAASKPRGK